MRTNTIVLLYVITFFSTACGESIVDAPGGSGVDSTQHPVSSGWDPGLSLSSNSNEWWFEVWADDESTAELLGETADGSTFSFEATDWGSFAANRYLETGSSVRLIAIRSDGVEARTTFFAYLQESPELEMSAGSSEPVLTGGWDPALSLGSNCNTWWIEVFARNDEVAAVAAETADGEAFGLPATSWGSFATNRYLAAGTSIRLIARRDDGAIAATPFFAYLEESAPAAVTEDSGTEDPGTEDSGTEDPATVTATYRVEGGQLVDRCGEPVILRGINKMTIWTDLDGLPSFPEIAKTGANTVRIVWNTSGSASDLDRAIGNALDHGLLPMVELHDATGDFSLLPSLVDYWTLPEIVEVVERHQHAMLLNIGNEVGNWSVTSTQWVNGYTDAIDAIRATGLELPLVVDSRGWAHDVEFLLANGPALMDADPLGNVLFSTHQYDPSTPADHFFELFEDVRAAGLPLVVGEFGPVAFDCSSEVSYLELIEAAQVHGIGWYAWSWGPGNTPCDTFDMTSDNTFEGLLGWGLEVAVTHPDSIANTSSPANFTDTCQ